MSALLGTFIAIAGLLFAADLWAHGTKKPLTLGNAAMWAAIYIAGAMVFAGFVYAHAGANAASLFLSGFVMEKALSVDNLMVFVAIFAYFKIPDAYQHKVLHYGIIGAVVFRLVFVAIGAAAFQAFAPAIGILFGVVVLWSAGKMWAGGGDGGEDVDYSAQWYARWSARLLPFVNFSSPRFFEAVSTVKNFRPTHASQDADGHISLGGIGDFGPKVRHGTPLLMCLIAIEISDVLFSFDSVPVVIAITQDPVLIYSAMIFAILGLRSLYFVLSALMRYLVHLQTAVVGILFFIGIKLISESIHRLAPHFGFSTPVYLTITPEISLAVVLGALALGVIASIIWPAPASTSPTRDNGPISS